MGGVRAPRCQRTVSADSFPNIDKLPRTELLKRTDKAGMTAPIRFGGNFTTSLAPTKVIGDARETKGYP